MRLLVTACVGLLAFSTACEKRDADRTTTPTSPPAQPSTPPAPRDLDGTNGGSQTDQDLTQMVRQAVLADAQLAAVGSNLQITVANGTVTLRGTVRTQADKDAVANKARAVPGVQNVKNELTVSGG